MDVLGKLDWSDYCNDACLSKAYIEYILRTNVDLSLDTKEVHTATMRMPVFITLGSV